VQDCEGVAFLSRSAEAAGGVPRLPRERGALRAQRESGGQKVPGI